MDMTIGVEEELMVVDPQTGEIVPDGGRRALDSITRRESDHRFVCELLQSQIETNSKVCGSIVELEMALHETRAIARQGAQEAGSEIIAASTHPWASWEGQRVTEQDRYRRATRELQGTVRRYFAGGMHVHAGFASPDTRIHVMTAIRQYLPLMLALSASSPFQGGHLTGLKSYRTVVINTIPRSGMPGPIESWYGYRRIVGRYRAMGAIEDASELRWDIRPSASYPTIELRICDICPRVGEAVAIAALYLCLCRYLTRRIEEGQPVETVPEEVIHERRWIAQRYGTLAFMPWGDPPESLDIEDCLDATLALVAQDARALGCEEHLARLKGVLRDGSSADRQEDVYRQAMLDGASEREAQTKVVQALIAETVETAGA